MPMQRQSKSGLNGHRHSFMHKDAKTPVSYADAQMLDDCPLFTRCNAVKMPMLHLGPKRKKEMDGLVKTTDQACARIYS